jgi:hypothetical protein
MKITKRNNHEVDAAIAVNPVEVILIEILKESHATVKVKGISK